MDWNDYFYYDETSPTCLRWKVKTGPRCIVDNPAGWIGADGYWCIQLHKKTYLVHRIVWEIHHSSLVANDKIDHVNRLRTDNRIENLRIATDSQNMRNRSLSSKNTSGYKGVHIRKSGLCYAYITFNYKRMHLGVFPTAEDAARAYDAKAIELFGAYAKPNFEQ